MAATTDDGNVELQQLQQNLTSALQHHVKLQEGGPPSWCVNPQEGGPQLQQQHQQLLQQQWYEQQLLQQHQQLQQQQQHQQQWYEHQQQWYEHQHQQQEAPRKNAPRPGFWKSNCIAMARAIRRGDSADDIRAMARACIAKPLQGPV